MIARVSLLVGIVLGTVGAQSSCSADGSDNGPAFVTSLILRDAAGNVTDHFSRTAAQKA